jgi:hypothetical protein
MINNHWKLFLACVILALAAGCGSGGSSSSQPEQPPPVVQGLGKLELLTGKMAADLSNCHSINGPAAEAEYSHLMRATVYADAVYLAETGEGCTNVRYDASGFVPDNLRPAIRKLSGSMVETAIALNDYSSPSRPVMARYPSGFQRRPDTGEAFVLGYATSFPNWYSDGSLVGFDAQELARYTAQGVWDYYIPGLFRFTPGQTMASPGNLAAGAPGKPPAYVDEQGQAAGFIAPHDLEMDASGLLYLIDQGQIRTIDAGYRVKTLDLAALGIEGEVLALDSDHQGGIHVLTQRSGWNYSWYRLADGSKVDFGFSVAIGPGLALQRLPFAVVGNDLAVVLYGQIYRISGNDGTMTPLTGSKTPATPQELLGDPLQYELPQVEHIKYGVDGNLYIVLKQGVLVARNFK